VELIVIYLCSFKVLVAGGGAGGCSVAAKFASLPKGAVGIIDPAEVRPHCAEFSQLLSFFCDFTKCYWMCMLTSRRNTRNNH